MNSPEARPESGLQRQQRVALDIQRCLVEHVRTGGTDLMAAYRSGEVPDAVDLQPWRDFHAFIMNVVASEDYSISAGGQRNLRYAPRGFQLTYGANEGVLQHFHRNLARQLERGD